MSSASSIFRLSEDQVDCESEVELISLTTEKLPHYRLRADYSVRFSGYQHSDFNRAEQVKEEITELTNEQIHQTLEYFILCGLRVNKMTDTYEDCAALTLLVQEQRSHLDLAANIGLNLVEKNTQLEQRVASLEEQLEASKETMKQMRHQLTLKDDLLRMFHSEIDDSEDNSTFQFELVPSLRPPDPLFSLDKVNVKQLETKLNRLEEENIKLRDQQHSINHHTDLLESKETQLVNDCVSHILESTKTIDRLSVELNKKTNDYLNQHEEISRLLTSKIDLENKTHILMTEKDNLITQLRDHQTKEFTLTKEVADMRDRYDECINLLNEKQDEIRRLKRQIKREAMHHITHYGTSSPELDVSRSLAAELEESSRRDADEMDRSRTLRIMEQARTLNTAWVDADDASSSGFTDDGLGTSMVTMDAEAPPSDHLSGNVLLRRSIQEDCERRRLLRGDRTDNRSSSGTVTPQSLSGALQDSRIFSEALYHHQSSFTGLSSLNRNVISGRESPTFSHSNVCRYPDKLQLMKPLEGSQTLRAWQNLATPSLTKSLFEAQPHGVCFRGQQPPASSSESSPNSDKSQNRSDLEDVDYEEPAARQRTKEPPYEGNGGTFSTSRIAPPNGFMPSPSPARSPCPDPGSPPSTPINGVPPPSSWLDRLTVGAIMTSILGYSRTPPQACPASPGCLVPRPAASPPQDAGEHSLIGRLTHLPPLGRRKPPQSPQSGLNLLTSLATRPPAAAIHRGPSLDQTASPQVD